MARNRLNLRQDKRRKRTVALVRVTRQRVGRRKATLSALKQVKLYNDKMGGVDMLFRSNEQYPMQLGRFIRWPDDYAAWTTGASAVGAWKTLGELCQLHSRGSLAISMIDNTAAIAIFWTGVGKPNSCRSSECQRAAELAWSSIRLANLSCLESDLHWIARSPAPLSWASISKTGICSGSRSSGSATAQTTILGCKRGICLTLMAMRNGIRSWTSNRSNASPRARWAFECARRRARKAPKGMNSFEMCCVQSRFASWYRCDVFVWNRRTQNDTVRMQSWRSQVHWMGELLEIQTRFGATVSLWVSWQEVKVATFEQL